MNGLKGQILNFKNLVLVFLFSLVGLYADSKVLLEKVDANKYPMVHIYVRENKSKPLQGENIHITETREGYMK